MSDYRITCPRCDASVNIYPGYQCPCGWERPTVPLIDLTTLRAEVERMRDEASTEADRAPDGGVIEHWWIGKQRGMETVLDLIDKHTREGQ